MSVALAACETEEGSNSIPQTSVSVPNTPNQGLPSIPGGVMPEDSTPGDSTLDESKLEPFYYEINGEELIITRIKDDTVTKIVIPDGVTSIGNSAFEECDSLTSITFEGTVSI